MRTSMCWQLLLFLSVFPFGETLDKFAPVENPGFTGQRGRLLAHLIPWKRRPQCPEKPEQTEQTQKMARLCPSDETPDPLWPGLCPTRSRLIAAPQGALLVEREKDLSAYNWNSFGLRYGKRQTRIGKARVTA
ncbi:metastasis-suppressor KiSS-1 [Vombatus ursinus]|nr:metastasis-suppressor KiSS-1 [Vombatus ursinus]XP_027726648.1 metastasis-suppressor KiSS-1 [Vombatus ursinus]